MLGAAGSLILSLANYKINAYKTTCIFCSILALVAVALFYVSYHHRWRPELVSGFFKAVSIFSLSQIPLVYEWACQLTTFEGVGHSICLGLINSTICLVSIAHLSITVLINDPNHRLRVYQILMFTSLTLATLLFTITYYRH